MGIVTHYQQFISISLYTISENEVHHKKHFHVLKGPKQNILHFKARSGNKKRPSVASQLLPLENCRHIAQQSTVAFHRLHESTSAERKSICLLPLIIADGNLPQTKEHNTHDYGITCVRNLKAFIGRDVHNGY